jgi:hypothetical protein
MAIKKIYELKALIILALLASLLIVSMLQIANANIWPSAGSMALISAYCPAGSGQYEELNRLKKEMTAVRTLNHVRNMALSSNDEVIQALKNARTIMPFSDDFRTAKTLLSDGRTRILVASSQAQVVDEFSGMMLVGLDDSAARVSVGGG